MRAREAFATGILSELRSMMVCVLLSLLPVVLLITSSALVSSSGTGSSLSCHPRWFLFGRRCLSFYPVWSSWSDANFLCSQSGGDLVSIHTPEDLQFVAQVAITTTPVWLGGSQEQQNGSWFWTDDTPFRINSWISEPKTAGAAGACMEMTPNDGKLQSAPCDELKFYICSMNASSDVIKSTEEQLEPGIVPGVDLFDVLWSKSDALAEEILHSSSFLRELQSGHVTEQCYSSFMQQEALYLTRVRSTLEALIRNLEETDDIRPLLLDTLKLYSSTNQSLLASRPPQWLHYPLQLYHSVVLEEPVYWLVALSAWPCLRYFLAQELLEEPLMSRSMTNSFYQEWSKDSLNEVTWINRYKKVIKENQDHMDVFKAINIFREHMMAQKAFYKALVCSSEEGKQ
ncbi:macrophage mannose receptor 1-like [Oreochromis aureus]|uniref:macrophage mannose receptor 1-like n=1 Tax=Oreochromis aureus TaxID=47969 RepID=UPI0019544E7F|nr:macrophage mannose receptor 1-like [Oreochromis aureus]